MTGAESQIEKDFIEKLEQLKYVYRPDIRYAMEKMANLMILKKLLKLINTATKRCAIPV